MLLSFFTVALLAARPIFRRNHMVVTFSRIGKQGRLGNQLFQLAATIGLAESHGYSWGFPPGISHTSVGILFGLTGTFRPKLFDKRVKYVEQSLAYHELRFTKSKADVIDLEGFFQSPKYFAHSAQSLRNHLSFPAARAKKVRNKFPEIDSPNTVTLHVRRGDYLKYSDAYKVLGVEYYQDALMQFSNIDTVIVISDDIIWCQRQLDPLLPFRKLYSFSDELDDFVLMMLSRKLIIANSTFSWWAAFLKVLYADMQGAAKVVAPTRWYNHSGRLGYLNAETDLCLPRWICIKS